MQNIIMGDVTGSRSMTAQNLIEKLNPLVDDANIRFRDALLSPLTITLGDEFQGVAQDFSTLCEIVFWFQNEVLRRQMFRMHFVIVRGRIDTDINPDIAHGMLGEGLAHARELLTRKDRSRPRYQVDTGLKDQNVVFNELFSVLEGLENRWSDGDYGLIDALLTQDSDAIVGSLFSKDRSQIYKRRKTLLTSEYGSVRRAIHTLAQTGDMKAWRAT